MRERHGHSPSGKPSPTYTTWVDMRRRCLNPNRRDYGRYGGRGIGVCARWDLFSTFLADMGERPEGMTLDRVDNALGYSPENCRWASHSEQMLNRDPWGKSSFTGVTYHKATSKWQANITFKGTQRFLGVFKSEENAAQARIFALYDLNSQGDAT